MLVGQQIGPFAIEKELGSGAMGTVYRATHLESKQRVAIKIMAPGLTSEVALARFKREAAILKQLQHPNIVRLVASGRFHGTPFYAMEYVKGESLDHVMARRGRITWEEVVTLGQQLCTGLQHAHEKGIIHRDLKPSNLMVLADGTVKLTDFGIAKDMDVTQLTAANSTVGTASYMSPEQCRGERDLTHKSDLYSMGVMFYELLTGKKPFVAESVMEMFQLHDKGTFERPSRLVLDIPVWLDTLVCQLLEKKPEQRPYDASAVAQALGRIKEKVEAQQSAGIEAATARKIDRSAHQPKLDETDKEAARTLLHKKKRKKVVAFYRQGWFQGVAIAGVLLATGYIFYLVFIKPPSAEGLIEQAATLLKSDRREARRGPIHDFLRYYPDHAEARKVRGWADDIDRDEHDQAMHRRRDNKWQPSGQAEELFRQALNDENAGKLSDAAKSWNELLQYKNPEDDAEHSWHLVADKYLQQLTAVDELYGQLQDKVRKEKGKKAKKDESRSKEEELALLAVRSELENNIDQAKSHWQELKTQSEAESQRRWHLLAAKRVHELRASSKK